MHPDPVEVEELKSFNEKVGIERIFEMITNTKWPKSQMKPDPAKRPEQRRRLERLVDDDSNDQMNYFIDFPPSSSSAEEIKGKAILCRKIPINEKRTTKDIEIQEKVKNMIELSADDLPNKEDERKSVYVHL